MLIDTGSNRTIIRSNVININDQRYGRIKKSSQKICTAAGHSADIVGILACKIQLGDWNLVFPAVISSNIIREGIPGLDISTQYPRTKSIIEQLRHEAVLAIQTLQDLMPTPLHLETIETNQQSIDLNEITSLNISHIGNHSECTRRNIGHLAGATTSASLLGSEWESYKQEEPDIITCNEIADINSTQSKGDDSSAFQNVYNEITIKYQLLHLKTLTQ